MNRLVMNVVRTFTVSTIVSVLILLVVGWFLGLSGVVVAILLVIIELVFSFDNAIINSRLLAMMSPKWQRLFLTVGILIAVVGVRLLLPALLVAVTAGLGLGQTFQLALNDPATYAQKVSDAHPEIAAFGGTFLLLLALEFFALASDRPLWIKRIEQPLSRIERRPVVIAIVVVAIAGLAALPFNGHTLQTLVSAAVAVIVYLAINALTQRSVNSSARQSKGAHLYGMAAFLAFINLNIIDASFSLDGVLGAFALTTNVLLIAAGLGIGALYVRSLTVYMVRHKLLDDLVYLEHGAHYAVLLLALSLLVSVVVDIPSAIVGVAGLLVIAASFGASLRSRARQSH